MTRPGVRHVFVIVRVERDTVIKPDPDLIAADISTPKAYLSREEGLREVERLNALQGQTSLYFLSLTRLQPPD